MMNPAELQTARHFLGLTQAQLAVKLGGYHAMTVSRWERGTCHVPPAVRILVTSFVKAKKAALNTE